MICTTSSSYLYTSELERAAISLVETCISGVLRIATSMPLKCQDVMEATPIVIGWMNETVLPHIASLST